MIFLLGLFISLSSFAETSFDLSGMWLRSGATSDERPLQFILINKQYHYHGTERFIFEDGRPSHTIEQNVKLSRVSEDVLEGSVDFFDSRGCSFKGLPVKAQFMNENTVNVLMTVPRYKHVTVTRSRDGDRYYPHRRVIISSHTECRLLEHVEVPVQLLRM